jgi:hypothetical protein
VINPIEKDQSQISCFDIVLSSKWKNKTLFEALFNMFHDAKLLKAYWGEAILMTAYFQTWHPTRQSMVKF